ncbi:MAG: hypothetical protein UR93_C0001G0051 [Berkelbacteria bacterium GW2011_GWA2_35_9]|uniref:Peptidase C39-like domain-containing protein n=1 Tax=Berkelbacteria bacterium GW2011_GWA2_35_9 TaxID=1618333 RepID=A0A0G0D4R7_9BACT|nr:MAG: hypothetical protein UR93_C0001G0051 [Berkelbacteria bacterium GW2011_GWA2_35_9]
MVKQNTNTQKELKVPFNFKVRNKGCALACVEMIMSYYHQNIDVDKIYKSLAMSNDGLDLFEVASELSRIGYQINGGFTDEDITFGVKNHVELINDKILKKIDKNLVEAYKGILMTMDKNKNIKIHRLVLRDIKESIDKNEPIIINLLSKGKNEFMHSVCVIGYNENDIVILNPPKIGKEYIQMETFFNLHQESGGYYFSIKRRSI